MTITAQDPQDLKVFDVDTYAEGDPNTFGLPLDKYEWLQEHAPVFKQTFDDPMLIDECWVVSRNEDIWEVDRNQELYAADRGGVNIWAVLPINAEVAGGPPALLTQDGEKHRAHRAIMSKAFTPKIVKRLEEKFRQYAVTIIDEALDKGTFNFVQEIGHAMPMEALGDVLGVPPGDRAKFFGWVDTFAAPFDTRITPSFDYVVEAIGNLMVYSTELAEMKRTEPGDDVMTKIVEAGDAMTEEEIMGNVALLASGAAESTRTAMSHGIHEMMRNPEQMAWIRERKENIPATAIQEIVRIASPFTHLNRTVTRDHELHGQQIKEGDKIAMLFAAGNFDPRAFDKPREFNLAREDNPHVSFGRGPHQCLGKHVASLEMKILFEELFQRTKTIEPAGEIEYVRDAYSRGVYDLPVTITPA